MTRFLAGRARQSLTDRRCWPQAVRDSRRRDRSAPLRVGGKRTLVIPQVLGYGEAGSPPKIPPRAGLKFDIELLDVNPKDAGAGTAPEPPPPDLDPGMDQETDPEMQ